MKIYKPNKPQKIIRLVFRRQRDKIFYVNLIETSVEEVIKIFKEHIETLSLSPFLNGYRTQFTAREYIGAHPTKKKSVTVSFRGLSPKDAYDLFLKNIPLKIKSEEKAQKIIRLRIGRLGEGYFYLALTETSVDKVHALINKIVKKQNLNPSKITKQKTTRVYIHESIGWKANKHINCSFKGLSAKGTMDLFIKTISAQ